MRKGFYVYVLNLTEGRRYVGYSRDPERRIAQHKSGRGCEVTKEAKVVSVHSVREYRSENAALQGEKDEYHRQCSLLGNARVRGANSTRRFSGKVAKRDRKGGVPGYVRRNWVSQRGGKGKGRRKAAGNTVLTIKLKS
jgi:predicted GIY-YIG superfamily endonuclease